LIEVLSIMKFFVLLQNDYQYTQQQIPYPFHQLQKRIPVEAKNFLNKLTNRNLFNGR